MLLHTSDGDIPFNQVALIADGIVHYKGATGYETLARTTSYTEQQIAVAGMRFLEVLDREENQTILPFSSITALRCIESDQGDVFAVDTISGERFFADKASFNALLTASVQANTFGIVSKITADK